MRQNWSVFLTKTDNLQCFLSLNKSESERVLDQACERCHPHLSSRKYEATLSSHCISDQGNAPVSSNKFNFSSKWPDAILPNRKQKILREKQKIDRDSLNAMPESGSATHGVAAEWLGSGSGSEAEERRDTALAPKASVEKSTPENKDEAAVMEAPVPKAVSPQPPEEKKELLKVEKLEEIKA